MADSVVGQHIWFHRNLYHFYSASAYAERCISYSKSIRLSVRLSVTRWHCVKTTKRLQLRSCGFHWRI